MRDIEEDLRRAQEALSSAERNFAERDFLTAANRAFVACENAVCVLMKLRFGSTSISRKRILTRLQDIKPAAKVLYDKAYDLRVQADYGRQAAVLPLNEQNVRQLLGEVGAFVRETQKLVEERKEMRASDGGRQDGA